MAPIVVLSLSLHYMMYKLVIYYYTESGLIFNVSYGNIWSCTSYNIAYWLVALGLTHVLMAYNNIYAHVRMCVQLLTFSMRSRHSALSTHSMSAQSIPSLK